MTLEMRKTLLIIAGFCLFLIVLEGFVNSGSVSRLSLKFQSSDRGRSRTGLATDGLDVDTGQVRDDQEQVVGRKDGETGTHMGHAETEFGEKIGRSRKDENEEGEERQGQEVIKMKEVDNKGATQYQEGGESDKKKKDEKVLEDEDVNDEVDSDVEEEKPSERKVGEDDDEEGELDEKDELENERLAKSPYIVKPEEEQRKLFVTPTMTEMKLVSEWHRQTPYTHSFKRCRYNMCKWETDNSLADAVIFRAGAIRTWKIKPFPRKPGSRWIFYTNDPAVKSYGLDREDVGSNINATSTYQLHSDFPRPFGRLRRVKPPAKDYGAIYDGKDRQVAWFVSHCNTWSKREQYVERMRKIIKVDVFGACGNMTCGASHYRGNDTNVCLPMLSEHYKFYLAFENSFCKDYVSEKFFKLFQGVDVIPVVQGGFDYHRYMPSNVFVDSSDFATPEDLAYHLLEISADKYRYKKMLRRKARWTHTVPDPLHCVVCEKLHKAVSNHFYTDMVAAFNGKPPECYGPPWLEREEKGNQDAAQDQQEDDEEEDGEVN